MRTLNKIYVSSEVGTLRKLIVHSPDSGLGKVVPSKAQDWLFEDIVHLDTIRRKEYDYYTKILMYFIDPEKIKNRLAEIDNPKNNYQFYKPNNKQFHASNKIIEVEQLLFEILQDDLLKLKIVAAVCAIENCSYEVQEQLLKCNPLDLTRIFVSGTNNKKEMLFPPVPNFIFTRDIGIVINNHILLNRPARKARVREALLMRYIFFNHPLFNKIKKNIIELKGNHHHFLLPKDANDKRVTLEGGDIMVVSKNHVLVGVSERTSIEAAHQTVNELFARNVVDKVSVVRIPKKRDYMHIDTVFTQVKTNMWVLLGIFSKKHIKKLDSDPVERALEKKNKEEQISIIQFHKDNITKPIYFDNLEDLLKDVSKNDLKCTEKVQFIYSGDNEFPFDAREQWTDSCNLLALKNGVVIGYDRNDKTLESFKNNGFNIVPVQDLIQQLENDTIKIEDIKDTFITMPSAELSRARGGFHCMSMPLLRDDI